MKGKSGRGAPQGAVRGLVERAKRPRRGEGWQLAGLECGAAMQTRSKAASFTTDEEVEPQGQMGISPLAGSDRPVQWLSALAAGQNNLGTLTNTLSEAQLQTDYIGILGKGSQAPAHGEARGGA